MFERGFEHGLQRLVLLNDINYGDRLLLPLWLLIKACIGRLLGEVAGFRPSKLLSLNQLLLDLLNLEKLILHLGDQLVVLLLLLTEDVLGF